MATYKVSYLDNDSYSQRGEYYADNVVDEYDAVEHVINKYGLSENIRILSVDLISE